MIIELKRHLSKNGQSFLITTQDPSVETFWIGLTKEVPIPVGFWKWVYPGDPSSVYSNWKEGKVGTKFTKTKKHLF